MNLNQALSIFFQIPSSAALRHSLPAKALSAIMGICFLACISLGSSIWFAVNADSDAAAINIAGSLRMQSWRLSEQVLIPELTSQDVLAKLIAIYDESIDSLPLAELKERPDALGVSYRRILHEWYDTMRPLLNTPQGYSTFIDQVPAFVDHIDHLVTALQQHTEKKLNELLLTTIMALLGIMIISFAVVHFIKKHLLEPVQHLSHAATQVRNGQFKELNLPYRADNEIGQLTGTFREMSEDLSNLYSHLADKVEEQTRALARSNEALALLYDASRTLGGNPYNGKEVSRLISGWQQLLMLKHCYICLSDTADSEKLHRIETREPNAMALCNPNNCSDCIKRPINHLNPHRQQFPLIIENQTFGFLYVEAAPGKVLSEEGRQWLHTFSDIVATTLYQSRNEIREQHILLMEERAVIARELHDSLAQALSFQKIQMVRLKRQIAKTDTNATVSSVIKELQDGLNNAYRQLRELLSTFRLPISGANLEQALQQTLAEYQIREPELECVLNYQLRYCPMDAHQQIHVIQIVREALSNVVKHAQARKVEVNCHQLASGQVSITIDDDGKGISQNPEKAGHFGVIIMKERASTLGGSLTYEQAPAGGARIALTFEVTANND